MIQNKLYFKISMGILLIYSLFTLLIYSINNQTITLIPIKFDINKIGLFLTALITGSHIKIGIIEAISSLTSELLFQNPITYLIITSYYLLLLVLSIVLLKNWILQKQSQKQIIKLENSISYLLKSQDESLKLEKEILHINKNKKHHIRAVKGCKKRILTYIRNELVPISIEDIYCIYVENQVTYVLQKCGSRSITNLTLSNIYNCLDKDFFFKINRQVIISIDSVNKIVKIDENKLKVEIDPIFKLDIVIGKNKVAQFKKWLDLDI